MTIIEFGSLFSPYHLNIFILILYSFGLQYITSISISQLAISYIGTKTAKVHAKDLFACGLKKKFKRHGSHCGAAAVHSTTYPWPRGDLK